MLISKETFELGDHFEHSVVPMHCIGADGTILRVNQAELDLLGYDHSEYIGQPFARFHADASAAADILQRLSNGEKLVKFPARLRAKDGTIKHVLLNASGRFRDGMLIDFGCITIETNAAHFSEHEENEKRAEEVLRRSEFRWRTMTEALPNLVWTDLPNGQCDWLSSQWAKYTGIPVQELLGLNWLHKVIHPEDRERTLECWQAACEDRCNYDLEYRIRRHDGEYRWFKTRGVPIRDEQGRIVYWFGSCTDIEDVRQAEQRERALVESNLAATVKFEAVFNQSGIFAGITDLEGRLLEINDLAVQRCGYTKEQVLNRLFWDTPWWRGSEEMRAHVRLATQEAAAGNVFREVLRYWDADTRERIMDFAMHPIRDQSGAVRFLHPTGFDITAQRKVEERLREREATFRAMFSISSVGKVQAEPVSGKFLRVNPAMCELTGYCEVELLRLGFQDITHPADWPENGEGLRRLVSGEAGKFDAETRYVRKDGSIVWVRATVNLISSDEGQPLRTTAVIQDITDRKKAEEQAHMLMREVNHRAKNMLGLVQAIARQTAFSNPSDFITRFDERIQALAASQDLLVKSGWKNIPMEALTRAQLAHFKDFLDKRIALRGPQLSLTPAAAQTFGMVLHELATNATKYGALSGESGRVDISWTVDFEDVKYPRFNMQWVESGGPTVITPNRRGFGSTVLESLAKLSLRADVSLTYAATGLIWKLACPVEHILENGVPLVHPTQPAHMSKPIPKRARILVVEDETLAAINIAGELSDADFEVIGPAASVAEAFNLLSEHRGCDAAVLDVNLGRETSEPIAQGLSRSGVPFVIMSGYAREQLPLILSRAPFLPKPLREGLLIDTLRQCLNRNFRNLPFTALEETKSGFSGGIADGLDQFIFSSR